MNIQNSPEEQQSVYWQLRSPALLNNSRAINYQVVSVVLSPQKNILEAKDFLERFPSFVLEKRLDWEKMPNPDPGNEFEDTLQISQNRGHIFKDLTCFSFTN